MNATIKTMKSHKSIRKYKDLLISEEIILELIRAGQGASTSNFAQAYSIIRIDNKETRLAFFHLTKGQEHILHAPLFLVFVADLERARKSSMLYHETMDEGGAESFIIATVDTALMAQNMLVAAESLGLGGVYIGGIRNEPTLVKDLLHLPNNTFPIFGMCLGYPDENHEIKPRLPVDVIFKNETYDGTKEDGLIKEYDDQIKVYYRSRNIGQRVDNWSNQMALMFSKPLRPHMKKFLNDQHLNYK